MAGPFFLLSEEDSRTKPFKAPNSHTQRATMLSHCWLAGLHVKPSPSSAPDHTDFLEILLNLLLLALHNQILVRIRGCPIARDGNDAVNGQLAIIRWFDSEMETPMGQPHIGQPTSLMGGVQQGEMWGGDHPPISKLGLIRRIRRGSTLTVMLCLHAFLLDAHFRCGSPLVHPMKYTQGVTIGQPCHSRPTKMDTCRLPY